MNFKMCMLAVCVVMLIQQSLCATISDSVKNSTSFSLDLYRNIFKSDVNVVASPYSLRILLSLLYQASKGLSETELRQKVYFDDKISSNLLVAKEIDHVLASSNIKLINKIYVKRGATIKSNFAAIVSNYKSEVDEIDFSQPSDVTDQINLWVAEHTNGLIQNLIQETAVKSETALFLVNAMYFKANWADQFPKDSVRNSSFRTADKIAHSIPFMSRYGGYRQAHLTDLKLFALEIPYMPESNFVFWLLLPDEGSSIEEIKNKLQPDTVLTINQKLAPKRVYLEMPLFAIETSVDFKDLLNGLGIKSIFDNHELDIIENELLKVDNGKQKNKIVVDTAGTEAASANYISAVPASTLEYIEVNRPFVYMILTADFYELIFIGHFSDPN